MVIIFPNLLKEIFRHKMNTKQNKYKYLFHAEIHHVQTVESQKYIAKLERTKRKITYPG